MIGEPQNAPRTVVEELATMEERAKELRAVECVTCGHGFGKHYAGFCAATRYDIGPDSVTATNCRCRRFVDPVEVLT